MGNKIMPILLVIIIILLLSMLIYLFVKHETINKKEIEIIDTTYNHIVLDSIRYNIIYRDSIIYHIKHEYEDSIKQSITYDDSTSLELFKRLVSE